MRFAKLSAALTAAMVLATAAFAGVAVEGSDDSEAAAGFAIGFIAGALIGGYIGFQLGEMAAEGSCDGDASLEATVRANEASNVEQLLSNGEAFTVTHMDNLSLIWSFTNDHWTRQAEVAASSLWGPDAEFMASRVLEESGAYWNASIMLANSASQLNEFFDGMSDRVAQWGGNSIFDGRMSLDFGYGSAISPAAESFGCELTLVASPAVLGGVSLDEAYISSETVSVLGGGSGSVASASGEVFESGPGGVIAVPGPGVYTLEPGRQYAGGFLPVASANDAPVRTAMILECDSGRLVAECEDGIVAVDGSARPGLVLSVGADSSPGSDPMDLGRIMEAYDGILEQVRASVGRAKAAAESLWGVYDAAGEATPFLTTLALPEFIEGVELTDGQRSVMSVLALRQLSEFYRAGEEDLLAREYVMTEGSMSLFVRGDVLDANGNLLYGDVVYTPFFCRSDETLAIGSNPIGQRCIVSVWDSGVESLSGWDAEASASSGALADLPEGSVLYVSEMLYGGEPVQEVDLTVERMRLIAPADMGSTPMGMVVIGSAELMEDDLRMILLWSLSVLGAAVALLGYFRRSVALLAIGVAVICAGLAGSAGIASFIVDSSHAFETFGGWF